MSLSIGLTIQTKSNRFRLKLCNDELLSGYKLFLDFIYATCAVSNFMDDLEL